MKVVIAILIGAIILGGGWWLHQILEEKPTITVSDQTAATSSAVVAADISSRVVDEGIDATTSAPLSKVIFTIRGKEYDTGTYLGSCSEVSGLLENELSGSLCWFAGGGDEVGVFRENGQVVIKHGEVEEGTAESSGFRGNWKTLFTIE